MRDEKCGANQRGDMGIADRDYHREGWKPSQHSSSRVTPVVKALLILNAVIFLIDIFKKQQLEQFGAFAIQSAIFEGKVWEFLTFQFLHGSVGHVLMNCIGLFFFGPWMEKWWGAGRFLIFYLICGAAGAAFFALLVYLKVVGNGYLIGASAGVYGILIGVALIAPNLRVRLLLPPIELSMRQLAMGILLISVGVIVFQIGDNEGGEAGHLGGAILGFLLVKFPQLLGRGSDSNKMFSKQKARAISQPKLAPRTRINLAEDSQVDLILDKISRDGFQSLTAEEREILQQASSREK